MTASTTDTPLRRQFTVQGRQILIDGAPLAVAVTEEAARALSTCLRHGVVLQDRCPAQDFGQAREVLG